MMYKILIIVLSSIVLFGCNENQSSESNSESNPEYGNIPPELIDSLKDISGNNQVFQIDHSKSNTVVGKKGTILIIPKNSIVTKDGKRVNGKITLLLKESFTIQDFITSNLQTRHNDKILESTGMIYFSAQDESGEELKIASNNSIRIQIPQKEINADSKIFIGSRNDEGSINWGEMKEPTKSLVPFPIKFISKNRFPTECADYYGITIDTFQNNNFNYFGDISRFENTLLATQEFAERFNSTCWDQVLKIYIDNLDKNLWEIDELVVDHFIKDSIERVEFQINDIYPGLYGGPRTKDQIEAHEWLVDEAKKFGHWCIELYKKFAAQKLTKVDPTKIIDSSKIKDINSAMISYDAIKFGWVNVDFFYNDAKAVPVKLIAKTNKNAPLITLIINGRNVMLSGNEKSKNEYWFTKSIDGYNKLPKGEKATIIAIGLNDNELLFAEKEIIIGRQEVENIELKPISSNKLKQKLEKYGS